MLGQNTRPPAGRPILFRAIRGQKDRILNGWPWPPELITAGVVSVSGLAASVAGGSISERPNRSGMMPERTWDSSRNGSVVTGLSGKQTGVLQFRGEGASGGEVWKVEGECIW